MAYMRGNCYVWRDDRAIHFWAMDGHDSWDESVWVQSRNNGSAPSGVSLPQEVADEYVVMRVAELVRDGLFMGAVDRALASHAGHFGCAATRRF